jgi:hypothetical protein
MHSAAMQLLAGGKMKIPLSTAHLSLFPFAKITV